mmetsp:Transcript_24475/g.27342  ORF Transcript_24475/g.27342 Transcript_24475/m.27342 type:complete len:88 (-) Transcript_24475:207-470(-)
MKLNKFWKIFEEHRSTRPISIGIYPDVLEVLTKKPVLLYKFLREEDHTQLFGSFYNNIRCSSSHHNNRRRRSVRKTFDSTGKCILNR